VLDCRPHRTFLEEDEVDCCQALMVSEIGSAEELIVERTAVAREAVEVPLTSWDVVAGYEDMASPYSEMIDKVLSTLLLVKS
jgi:hypothetical protein